MFQPVLQQNRQDDLNKELISGNLQAVVNTNSGNLSPSSNIMEFRFDECVLKEKPGYLSDKILSQVNMNHKM